MPNIDETINAFSTGKLDKAAYIKTMYEQHHAILFDYAENLARTNISKIEIEDGRVIMTSRDKGIRISCGLGDHRIAPVETLNFQDYEKAESDMLHALIGENDVVLDIGANIGWYSISIAKTKRDVRVHAFEPIPRTYAQLSENVALNPVGKNIQLNNFGLSNKAEELTFYYYPEGSGNASSSNLSERTDVEKISCLVRTMDEYVEGENIVVDFIKCDVEGAELFAFLGGAQTIARDKPIVFSEILRKWSAKFNYDPNDIFSFFFGLGYRSFTVKDGFLFEFKEMTGETIETNFFFLHQEKHAEKICQFLGSPVSKRKSFA